MNSYWRSVASVLTGTVVAQIIPILGSLVIARLYAPAEFGMFSAWLGVVLLLGVMFTGRFETALAIEMDGEPRRLSFLATLTTACMVASATATLISIAAVCAPGVLEGYSTSLIAALVPTALAIAVAQTWQSWAAAEGSYRQLSLMRIVQAAVVTLLQIVAGVFHAAAGTLAVAYLVGVIVGIACSAYLMPAGSFPVGQGFESILKFWRRQRRFPLLSLPADAINTAAAQLPLLIVASRFGAEVAGLLAMTMRILGAPIGLLGKSVLDVFKRHASTSFRERGECQGDYIRTFKVLALGSFAFCLVMFFASESLFVLAFGKAWREAGTIAIWLLPLFALRFIASPLSYMVYIADKQHVDLFWQIALLGMTVICLSVPSNHKLALQLYSAGYSMLYVIYLMMSYRFSLGVKV